ncbi:MAG: hypothetical protein SVR94_12220 [Pseudomonadota bacterium]|nr:hypothetical protein [Pseudomonadota bacterium]
MVNNNLSNLSPKNMDPYQFTFRLMSWQTALVLLSLDRVKPLWEQVGLNFNFPNEVLQCIRFYVLEQQKLEEYANNTDDDLDYTPKEINLIDDLLMKVQKLEGNEEVCLLRDWIENDFVACDRAEVWLKSWRMLFLRLARSQAPDLLDKIPADKHRQLVELAKSWEQEYDEIAEQIEQTEAQPLVGWDGKQYEIYRYETPDISPIDSWSLYLKCRAFKKVWQKVINLLNIEEMEHLNHWGEVEALVKMKTPASMVTIPLAARQPQP